MERRPHLVLQDDRSRLRRRILLFDVLQTEAGNQSGRLSDREHQGFPSDPPEHRDRQHIHSPALQRQQLRRLLFEIYLVFSDDSAGDTVFQGVSRRREKVLHVEEKAVIADESAMFGQIKTLPEFYPKDVFRHGKTAKGQRSGESIQALCE